MSKVCFVDNDILLKLVACNLFKEASELLEVEQQNIKFLRTSKKVIRRNCKLQTKYSNDIRDRAINIIDRHFTITVKRENLTKIEIVETVNDIDPGEAILLAAALEESNFFLMTGDKRFLRALANTTQLDSFYKRVRGKVVCLELLIYKLIQVRGFQPILEKVVPVKECDTALKRCFGSGNKAEERIVLKNLALEIQDIQKSTQGILAEL